MSTTPPHYIELLPNQGLDPETLLKSKQAASHLNDSTGLPSPDDLESDETEATTPFNNTNTFNHTITNTSGICHGRVKNPEAMVSKTWWKIVFSDQIYLQTDGDVVEDPAITLEEVRLLTDIGAVRQILQASAATQLNKDEDATAAQLSINTNDQINISNTPKKGHVQFSIGDCRSIPYADNAFNMILVMGNSFGYFSTDKDDETVLFQIYRVLKPGGLVVLDITDGAFTRENYSPRGWEWIDDEMMVCRERWLSEDRKRLVCREVVIKTAQGVIRDQSQAVAEGAGLKQVYREDDESQVKDLEIKLGKEMSQRGEDLGMMEQRNFVIATKPTL
ncbi:hypothetical protein BGX29_004999 [Mortierella sp. GBA35]|nr:hypothetical protein BGX29_004999 [Mortierella sp. GBA35]